MKNKDHFIEDEVDVGTHYKVEVALTYLNAKKLKLKKMEKEGNQNARRN